MEPELQEDEESEVEISGASPRLAFVQSDVNILRQIYDHRFLRREHLAALTSRSPVGLHRRLYRLCGEGYLTVLRLPLQKHIYALGKAAAAILVEQGIAAEELLDQRLRVHELKEFFLKHEMMIVDIHVLLTLASRTQGDLRLTDWREGRELFDSVHVADFAGVTKLPVRPDAFFTITDGRRPEGANRANFFLEADRSTATQARFKDKIRAYWHYLEQGLHTRKLNIRNFRVLTVTLTHERAKNLRDLAESILPERARKHFFFTAVKNFSLEAPASIFESVYLSARESEAESRVPLIAEPMLSANRTH